MKSENLKSLTAQRTSELKEINAGQLVEIDAGGAPLGDLALRVSTEYGLNVVVAARVAERQVFGRVSEVDAGTALAVLAKSAGVDARRFGGIWLVGELTDADRQSVCVYGGLRSSEELRQLAESLVGDSGAIWVGSDGLLCISDLGERLTEIVRVFGLVSDRSPVPVRLDVRVVEILNSENRGLGRRNASVDLTFLTDGTSGQIDLSLLTGGEWSFDLSQVDSVQSATANLTDGGKVSIDRSVRTPVVSRVLETFEGRTTSRDSVEYVDVGFTLSGTVQTSGSSGGRLVGRLVVSDQIGTVESRPVVAGSEIEIDCVLDSQWVRVAAIDGSKLRKSWFGRSVEDVRYVVLARLGRGDDEATEERPRATREPEETTTAPSGLQPPPNVFLLS